jgi:hypothetical protein
MAKTPGGTVRVQRSGRRRIRRKNAAGVADAAARDVDATDVAGKPARPNFDEHPAAPPSPPPPTSLPLPPYELKTPELESVTESP